MNHTHKKIIWIMLDSVGVGALPDAIQYGDDGANTCRTIARTMPELSLPILNGMGLHHLVPEFAEREKATLQKNCYYAKMAEQSKGKDTITGHWEFAGILTEESFPTFPNGFPETLVKQLEQETGVGFLGNEVASGTEIIARLGAEHMRTGKPILYTSADSVLQIAAHEEIIPVSELYRICEIARERTRTGPYKVGRVIARPFIGKEGAFVRTANRHDYALEIPKNNLLQQLSDANVSVYAVGKIADIYAGTTFYKVEHSSNNTDGMKKTMECYRALCAEQKPGIVYTNLVDFDMQYGHRRDIQGYGNALQLFDAQLARLLDCMDDDTILILTADHGCDPGFFGTDHTREYVPLFLYGDMIRTNICNRVVTYQSFADLGATIAEYFAVPDIGAGTSFAKEVFAEKVFLHI